jgi:phosphatidylglycerol lysyltransferase
VLGFAFRKLLAAGPSGDGFEAAARDLDKVRAVLAGCQDAAANVALLGDKRFLWSADEQAFVMYQISGDSWIAMGDPVGPESQREALIWAFRELVDRHNGRPVFYQVSDRSLPLYIDQGLSLSKLGEDGRVPLENFSLEGSRRADLRQAVKRAAKHGATFAVLPRAEVPGIVPDLQRVSDSWLADKSTAEKAFSLGSFSPAYIENFDCAVIRTSEGIVAFANLWTAPASAELSIDLMRYDRRAPKSTMDYMFAELMVWAAAAGYEWFSLGMAPLSGMEQRPLAPLWHKLGHLLYMHGESFYNFEGLRSYKEKFDPVWRPRYLACPGGVFDLPWALIDSSRLISGSLTRMLTR